MKWKMTQQDLRTWILFFVGIGLVVLFATRGSDPGPYWTMIIGTFVGLGVIVSAGMAAFNGKEKRNDSDKADVRKHPSVGQKPRSDEGMERRRVLAAWRNPHPRPVPSR